MKSLTQNDIMSLTALAMNYFAPVSFGLSTNLIFLHRVCKILVVSLSMPSSRKQILPTNDCTDLWPIPENLVLYRDNLFLLMDFKILITCFLNSISKQQGKLIF